MEKEKQFLNQKWLRSSKLFFENIFLKKIYSIQPPINTKTREIL